MTDRERLDQIEQRINTADVDLADHYERERGTAGIQNWVPLYVTDGRCLVALARRLLAVEEAARIEPVPNDCGIARNQLLDALADLDEWRKEQP